MYVSVIVLWLIPSGVHCVLVYCGVSYSTTKHQHKQLMRLGVVTLIAGILKASIPLEYGITVFLLIKCMI